MISNATGDSETRNNCMIEAALFPIPGSVNFPSVPCSLHVFEPRYRQMVRHCIDNSLLLGVCHTEKLLHANVKPQTTEEALSSNQSTYKPCAVFSAGPVDLVEELGDGRLLINVDHNIRLQLRREIQTLPFSIWQCEELADQSLSAAEMAELQLGKEKVLRRLLTLTHNVEAVQKVLHDEFWQDMPALQFSFAVTGLLGTEADVKQQLLEMTDPRQRLTTVLALLNAVGKGPAPVA
jgi:Lon protease-like protein